MPWSNQGGGRWGRGGGGGESEGHWGSGPHQSGPTPPDLEEFQTPIFFAKSWLR